MEKLLRDIRRLDWTSLDDVSRVTVPTLEAIAADPSLLEGVFRDAAADPNLRRLGEHLPWCDKIVLHDDDTGFRVRLHVFHPGYEDLPHSHRFAFSSLILHGGYRHSLWGREADALDDDRAGRLRPIVVRDEVVGSRYTLDDDALHCFRAEPGTVSLIIHGPAVKERAMGFDKASQRIRWKQGAAGEPQERKDRVRLLDEHLASTGELLRRIGVL